MCNVAERAKSTVLALLQQPDQWKTPIVVNAQPPQANLPELPAAALNLSQTGFGLKLQLDLTIGADLDAPAIERELLRVILVEMMYRRQPNLPVGTAYVRPPEWLVDGIQAWGSQLGPAEFGAPLKNPVATHKIVSLENFLRQRPELLDSPSRLVYRSYSYALVSLLKSGKDLSGIYCRSSRSAFRHFVGLDRPFSKARWFDRKRGTRLECERHPNRHLKRVRIVDRVGNGTSARDLAAISISKEQAAGKVLEARRLSRIHPPAGTRDRSQRIKRKSDGARSARQSRVSSYRFSSINKLPPRSLAAKRAVSAVASRD